MGVLVAGLATVAVLTACGDDEDGVGFGGQPRADSTSTSLPVPPTVEPPVADGPVAPPEGTPLPPERVDATALPEGYPKLVWTLDDGAAVGMYGQGGGCTEVSTAVRDADDTTVRVAIVETTTSSGPCTMELSYPPQTVPLDEPLGERTVVLTREQVGPPAGR